MSSDKDLAKIEHALELARTVVGTFTSGRIRAELKTGGDPVTAADIELDRLLRETLVDADDGWLSEETADDLGRLKKRRVWIVDPLDGTREFIEGIDQWCISVALAVDGHVTAAGICNPAADRLFLGSRRTGVTFNGRPVTTSNHSALAGARILASRTEVGRGLWERFADSEFTVVPVGSVAYKLALVAAGLADATFTLVPKNEWDIAAGTFLVTAAGGKVSDTQGACLIFNRRQTRLKGLVAAGPRLFGPLTEMLGIEPQP
ncbi:MAG TPA: 3'(2'),5'-bisphosphate nucleotidase CysQ [Planctomycetes bacterium]|nr:3'(2'),5'-bisphosphate nucleotidase CysQ [Planctomycetota bacterium]